MLIEKAFETISHDWQNFSFRMLTLEDVPAVEEHMKHNFFTAEPISVIAGVTKSNCDSLYMDKLFYELIGHNLSFGAFDKDTGEMASVRMICRHKRGQNDGWSLENSSPELKVFLQFMQKLSAGCDICQMYQVDEYAHFRFVSVAKKWRGQGLAREMYRRAIIFLKAVGFKYAEGRFTGVCSRASARRLGFQELQRRYFRTLTDLQGNCLKLDAGDNEYASIMVLRIQ